jgi:hypothetical protein
VTRDEANVDRELRALARDDRGRALLQLALRGIQESGRGLTYGCWVKRDGGVSGCLFQHAYWQGAAEGVFAPAGAVRTTNAELKDFVGEEDFVLVMRAVRAFDALGRSSFRHWEHGRFGLPVRRLDEAAWRATVERLLIGALAEAGEGAGDRAAGPAGSGPGPARARA